jgi:hypothetical protein
MKNKKIISTFAIITFIMLVCKACDFAPGSYPYAEKYELNYSEEQVKAAIAKFKREEPQYLVPKVTINNKGSWDLTDGQSKEPSHWYGVYFYYKSENKILFTWIRPAGKNKTTLAFVSINEGLNLPNWKRINKDFGFFENRRQKKDFEERILDKINILLKEHL